VVLLLHEERAAAEVPLAELVVVLLEEAPVQAPRIEEWAVVVEELSSSLHSLEELQSTAR